MKSIPKFPNVPLITTIFRIDLTNNSLPVVQFNSTSPSRVELSGNPLECEVTSDSND